jgi:hypothetical protein
MCSEEYSERQGKTEEPYDGKETKKPSGMGFKMKARYGGYTSIS